MEKEAQPERICGASLNSKTPERSFSSLFKGRRKINSPATLRKSDTFQTCYIRGKRATISARHIISYCVTSDGHQPPCMEKRKRKKRGKRVENLHVLGNRERTAQGALGSWVFTKGKGRAWEKKSLPLVTSKKRSPKTARLNKPTLEDWVHTFRVEMKEPELTTARHHAQAGERGGRHQRNRDSRLKKQVAAPAAEVRLGGSDWGVQGKEGPGKKMDCE